MSKLVSQSGNPRIAPACPLPEEALLVTVVTRFRTDLFGSEPCWDQCVAQGEAYEASRETEFAAAPFITVAAPYRVSQVLAPLRACVSTCETVANNVHAPNRTESRLCDG